MEVPALPVLGLAVRVGDDTAASAVGDSAAAQGVREVGVIKRLLLVPVGMAWGWLLFLFALVVFEYIISYALLPVLVFCNWIGWDETDWFIAIACGITYGFVNVGAAAGLASALRLESVASWVAAAVVVSGLSALLPMCRQGTWMQVMVPLGTALWCAGFIAWRVVEDRKRATPL